MIKESKRLHRFTQISFCLILSFLLVSCSSKKDSRGLQVKVVKNGVEVDHFEDDLIQHFDLTEAEHEFLNLTFLNSDEDITLDLKPKRYPFYVEKMSDGRGEDFGLKIIAIVRDEIRDIGFEVGDILTAVGQKKMKKIEDFGYFVKQLNQGSAVSLTLRRNNMPHKFFYRLENRLSEEVDERE